MLISSLKHSFSVYGRTDAGCRTINEDAFIIGNLAVVETHFSDLSHFQSFTDQPVLLGVADGHGHDRFGTPDSQVALKQLNQITSTEHDPDHSPHQLQSAIDQVNTTLYKRAVSSDDGQLGTTICVALLNEDEAHLAHVGDSRIYLLRYGELYRLTTDHTLIAKQIEKGLVSEEEELTHPFRNVLLQVLGAVPRIDVEISSLYLKRGDRLLLCTDGLWKVVGHEEIKRVLNDSSHITGIGDQLIDLACRAGGHDNITVIVAECGGYGLPEPTEAESLSDILIKRKTNLANRNSGKDSG
jgi:serine/threonine protein phosphatase PrpC